MKVWSFVLLSLLAIGCSEPDETGAPDTDDTDPGNDDTDPPDDTDDPKGAADCTLADEIGLEPVALGVNGWTLDFDAAGRLITVDRSQAEVAVVGVRLDGTVSLVSGGWPSLDDARVLTNGGLVAASDTGFTVVELATGMPRFARIGPDWFDATYDVGADEWIYLADDEVRRVHSSTEEVEVLATADWSTPHGKLLATDVAVTVNGAAVFVLASPAPLTDGAADLGLYVLRRKLDGTWQAPTLVWQAPEPVVRPHEGLVVDACGNALVLTNDIDGNSTLWRIPANLSPAEVVIEVPNTIESIRFGSGAGGWSKQILFGLGDGLWSFDLGIDGTHVLVR